jgi:hypothetical protein
VDHAVEQYYKNLHSQGKDPKTIRAYKVAVEEFRKSCTKKFLSEIGRQDLIDFMGWLRKPSTRNCNSGSRYHVLIARTIRRSAWFENGH